MISKILVNVLGMIPGFLQSLSPTIVKVFPEPVWPYAKMHTLNPSIAHWINLGKISILASWRNLPTCHILYILKKLFSKKLHFVII